MPLSLSIQPSSDVLDMYGDAYSSLTFSLSGHVSISLTSPTSLPARRRASTHILLQSLTITFEGQSEVVSPSTGYAPIRLCSISRKLLVDGPVDLSNEGHESFDKPSLWNIVFDIPVPSWLPTTSVYEDASLQATGTFYALYATATFIDINQDGSPLSIANICRHICSRIRTVNTQMPIILQRFVEPQCGSCSSTFPMSVYVPDTRRAPDSDESSLRSIPDSVLEKIQVVASIPSATAMNEAYLPFVLRIRGKDLDNPEGRWLRITEFSVDVEQVEVYSQLGKIRAQTLFSIPFPCHQPPRVPLRNSHPIRTLYDTGFLGTFGSSIKRSFSILAPTESGRHIISGRGYIFTCSQSQSSEENWHILETKVPLLTGPRSRDWAGSRKRRITERSPLFSVEHYMRVTVHFEYNHADSGETIPEHLSFSLPVRLVNVPEVLIPSRDATEIRYEDVWKMSPSKRSLPAYSQLFHSNGEQRLDCLIPLPLYEPLSSGFAPPSDQERPS